MIAVPRLHVVTDDLVLGRTDFLPVARALLEAGGDALALHVRGRRADGRTIYELVHELVTREQSGGHVFVNDRVDVALTAGAAGIHLGQRSLSVVGTRALVGSTACVGISVHDAREARAASQDGADYAFVGTLHATPSHEGHGGRGPELLTEVAELANGLLLLGIGGVTPERVPPVLRAGGHGVAVIRGVWGASDPVRAVGEYLSVLEGRPSSTGDSN